MEQTHQWAKSVARKSRLKRLNRRSRQTRGSRRLGKPRFGVFANLPDRLAMNFRRVKLGFQIGDDPPDVSQGDIQCLLP